MAVRLPSLASVVKVPSRSTALFVVLSLLWYSCSFLSSSTSKALLSGKKVRIPSNTAHDAFDATANLTSTGAAVAGHDPANVIHSALVTVKNPPLFPYPVSLTALQFLFVFSFSYLLSSPAVAARVHRFTGRGPSSTSHPDTSRPQGLMGTLVMVNGAKMREMVGLSVFNVSGHAMTTAAIQMVPVSTVHTVKALSPLFTVLSYVLFLNLTYPVRTYISLAPLTIGVIFACSGLSSIEGTKAWLGIALSVGSTVIFVAQNLWSKKLLGHALSGGTSEGANDRRPSQGGGEVKLDKLNVLFWSSGISMLLMAPMLFLTDIPKFWARDTSASEAMLASRLQFAGVTPHTDGAQTKIASLLLANGVVHFTQNLLAFSVLGLTSPVTYSIASLFKRVFVICFAIIWFGQTVTKTQWVGICLTFVGLWLYNDSKIRGSTKGDGAGMLSHGGHQTLANREDEAAHIFGLDKGSRRRQGLLPTSGAASGSGVVGGGGVVANGPVWKGMSSSMGVQGNAQSLSLANGHAVTAGMGSRMQTYYHGTGHKRD
ncbi:unnamed protein product [Parajaminaea phylloscopi]